MQEIDTYLINEHSDDYASEYEEKRGTFANEPATEEAEEKSHDDQN